MVHSAENLAMSPKKKVLLERCIEDGLRSASLQIKDSKTDPLGQIADDLRFDAIIGEVEETFSFDNEMTISVQLGEKL